MCILVCGARGFIGRAIVERLIADGHVVLRGVRRPRCEGEVAIDYSRDTSAEAWLPRLRDVDAVINAVGILVERGSQTFALTHRAAPCALFEACRRAGVRRVVQVSALGATAGDSGYFRSKRAADEFLMALPIEWQVVRPALVYGRDGASAQLFRVLASLPVSILPGGGRQRLQPVHIDDLAEAVAVLLDPAQPARRCIDLVGAEPIDYRAMLGIYRRAMGFPPAPAAALPAALMAIGATALGGLPGAMLTPDTWRMLQAGNTGEVAATRALLGRAPRPLEAFIAADEAAPLRQQALAAWRGPLLRASLAMVWLVTAAVTLFAYPTDASLALLARVGLGGLPASVALYSAAALDLGFGLATLFTPGRRLWLAQMATILAYSAVIAVALPEFLLHPFAPIVKNLPMLAILLILFAEEHRP